MVWRDWLRRNIWRGFFQQVVQPEVTPRLHIDRAVCPLDHNGFLHRRTLRQRLIGYHLQGGYFAAAEPAIRGDEHLGADVIDSIREGTGAESGEDHGVDG